jgi:hypothetical protein
MNFCTTERCCQLQFINSYTSVLHDVVSERHGTGTSDDVRAVVGWPGLISCLTVICALLQLSAHWNTPLWHVAASSHMASWWHSFLPKQPCDTPLSKTLPSIVHDSTPLTDTIILQKWNLRHPLVPYIGWMFNSFCLITWAFPERLSIYVYTLHQWVSIIYEWPL